MKLINVLIILMLFASSTYAKGVGTGEEIVEPLRHPKFSFTAEYELSRKFYGFADDGLRANLKRRFDGMFAFEAGLIKYLNAGGLFSIGMTSFKEPIHMRMGLFAKPYVPLDDRFALFARVTGGMSVDLAFHSSAVAYYGSFAEGGTFDRVYKGQNYVGIPFGGFGAATLGLEVFPFSRVGLALEWGIRATLLHNRRSMLLINEPKRMAGAPDNFNFMLYELPLMLTLHVII